MTIFQAIGGGLLASSALLATAQAQTAPQITLHVDLTDAPRKL